MADKVGVYICGGCGISDVLDVEQLVKGASGAATKKSHEFLCGAEGLALVKEDLDAGTIDGVVVAACSPRVKMDAFDFGPETIVERANIREHVSWCRDAEADAEDVQAMGDDYVNMSIARAQKTTPPTPAQDEISKKILVVGGGITGITAASEAAAAGYDVVLVEKEDQLGGFLGKVKKRFPVEPPYTEMTTDGIKAKVDELLYNPKVKVCVSSKITKTEGQPGLFDITLETAEGGINDQVGSIIMATGWRPYDASKLGHLGYGASEDVVTNVELETLAATGEIKRPSDGKPVEDVLFVQCAGSRDEDHLPYCSSVCCMTSLKQISYFREQNPQAKAFVVYKDIRTPGQYEKFYRAAQDEPLNFLTKGEVAGVVKQPDGKLAVAVKDSLIGENIIIKVDLVVLATGMVPNSADGPLIRELTDSRRVIETGESEQQKAEAAKKVELLQIHDGSEILNLDYRQGPDLPTLRHGFPDSHFVCFPYETRRTGIYAAGPLRQPMDSARSEEDALGATMKAIQAVELAAQGAAVHPRALDTSFPEFSLQRCTQCKRCTEECPFGAINEDDKGTPEYNVYRCRRCGICMGACPERIINFPNYNVDQIASMVKAIEVPDEFEDEKFRIVVFMCENDAYPALDIAGYNHLAYSPFVRVIPVRCLGSVNMVWIREAMNGGIDGVMLVGCKYGDDYQCHYATGSELANQRLENMREAVERMQIEPERLQQIEISITDYDKLPVLINKFAEEISEMGMNPMREFA
jgi:quinone-modifying oxidoreductase, subunit QmoB